MQAIQTLLESRVGEIGKAAPAGLDPQRLARIALTTIANSNVRLIEACNANPASLWAAMLEASQLGLTLDGPLGQAFLVPRTKSVKLDNGKWIKQPIVDMQPGYKGYVALAVRGGVVSHVDSAVVREGDFFQYELGSSAYLRHIPPDKDGKRGVITYVYAVAYLVRGGPPPFVVLPKAKVEEYRRMSSADTERKDSPWMAHYEAMAKKTAIRRLCDGSRFPLTAELRQAEVADRRAADERMVLPASARVEPETEHVDPETGEVRQLVEAELDSTDLEPPPDREPGQDG
jgi:recombination protein RecT